MMEPAKYRQAMDAAPVTAWTKIAKAAHVTSPETRKSLDELIALYDKPLLKLFESIAGSRTSLAEDWKQDFIVSHLLTGKVFDTAKRGGRFRTYLAVAVRNYVVNRLAGDAAMKRQAESGAKPFSQMGEESDKSYSDSIAGPQTDEEYERILTRSRAWDIYNGAYLALERWCATQQDAVGLLRIAEGIKSPGSSTLTLCRPSAATRDVVAQFKEFVKSGVREELLVQPGEDEQFIAGREIGIFFDALREE